MEVIAEVSHTLGADNLKTLEYSGSGYDFAFGQAPSVKSPWPKFNVKTYTRTLSFEPWASSIQSTRTQFESPPRGGGMQPLVGEQRTTVVIAPGSPAAAALPENLAVTVPHAFLKVAAAAPDVAVTAESKVGKRFKVIAFTASNKAKIRGWVNQQNFIERVETTIDSPVLGDMKYEVSFTDYQNFNGVNFPRHIVQQQGGHPVLDLRISDVKANVVRDFKATVTPPPPVTPLATEQLGDGVYLITGGYASVVVDFKDHITIFESGQNEQRSNEVIAEAKRLIPGKPVKEIISTHPHFDHLGGLRAFVAEGATIITHANNKAYYQSIMKRPRTLNPDRLAMQPRKPTVKGVKDRLTLTDGERIVELYHQRGYGHHEGMLFAYLPKQKILIQADGFTPPAVPATQAPAFISPYTQNLVTNIERLGLEIERIIPVHLPADGRKVTMAELFMAVGKP
jgi:glyoxylase-like metal-dependent hydrolase (beta-lactamase superfamily II)